MVVTGGSRMNDNKLKEYEKFQTKLALKIVLHTSFTSWMNRKTFDSELSYIYLMEFDYRKYNGNDSFV